MTVYAKLSFAEKVCFVEKSHGFSPGLCSLTKPHSSQLHNVFSQDISSQLDLM